MTAAGTDNFRRQVRDALAHLYDPVSLQTHPLARGLGAPPAGGAAGEAARVQAGRGLHRRLLEAIAGLRPEGKAGAGPAARAHRLLELRYVEALTPPAVQRQLGIEKSQYYREHARAVAALTAVLAGDVRGDGDAAAGPVASLRGPAAPGSLAPGALPVPLTSFVGRERELGAVAALLAAHRLVTLTGPGGVGKTRLALRAAADAVEANPDGVWLAELAALADPALVPQAAAAAVGVREEPGRPLLATLADALRPRRLLLVLDNCEHLLDACAGLADGLLRACPGLRLLATSREALGLAGETVWRVPSLPVPAAGGAAPPAAPAAAGDLAQYAAVRLFCERAAAVQPGFALGAANAAAVVQVCARLDGIPLAIELAAARVRVLPPPQLLARLEDRFRLLTGGSRTALERHQTLQAAVDWSYALLTAPERTLFARLAVFAGGWTLEAAEAVGADPAGAGIAPHAVLDLLTGLVDQSLVEAEAHPDGTARYRLLETLRQYARQRLADAGDTDAVRDRHVAHFAAVADRAGALHAAENLGDLPVLDEVEADLDNFRTALRWCHERADPGTGLRLAWRLARLWYRRGHLTEAREWLAAFLALPAAGAAPAAAAVRLAALDEAAALARFHGDHPAAAAYCHRWLALARERGDRRAVALALAGLGLAALAAREYGAARAWFAQSLPHARQVGNPTLSEALGQLALTAWQEGDLATARARFEEGLAGGAGRGRVYASALWGRFYLALEERDFGRARALLPAMAQRVADNPSHRLTAIYESAVGSLALAEGDHAAAGAAFRRTAAAWRATGDRGGVALVLAHFAALAAAQGQPARAARVGGAARRQLERFGGPYSPVLQAWLDRLITRATPVPLEGAPAHAWADGYALAPEQAVDEAVAGWEAGGSGTPGGAAARDRPPVPNVRSAPAGDGGGAPTGALRVDPATYTVWRGAAPLARPLAAKEFALVRYLYEHAGRVCPRQELGDAVWGRDRWDPAMLYRLVRRVREKLEPQPGHPRYLQTVSGFGYRLAR